MADRRWLGLVAVFVVTSAAGCLYDSDRAADLLETRPSLSSLVKAEVQRLLTLYGAGLPKEDERGYLRSVPDAFNDLVKEKWVPKAKDTGGTIRVQTESEPKRLNSYMDSSAVTRRISGYFYRPLLRTDPETNDLLPDLAESWETADIVWLRGRRPDSVFEIREKPEDPAGDNDYLVGRINPDSIVWAARDQGIAESLEIVVEGQKRVLTREQMRVRVNQDGSYRRMFDRNVVFTFHLRKDVRWHDGKRFTADDLIFTLDVIKNPYIPEQTQTRGSYQSVKYWEKLDDFTVRIWHDEQYFRALENYSDSATFFFVLPKHVFMPEGQKFTEEEYAKYYRDHPAHDAPVGCGPYVFPTEQVLPRYNPGKLKGWERGAYIRLLRSGDFYDPERRGYLDEIRFVFIQEADQTLRALRSGQIDFTPRWLGSEELFRKTLDDDFKSRYAKILFYTGNYSYVGFNMKKPYFQDVRVRKALTLLLNRKKLLETVRYGVGIIVSGSQYYFGPAYDRSIPPWPYNRPEAVGLLNEAGWIDTDGDGLRDKDGIPFEIEFLITQGSTSSETLAAMLEEELRTLGIRLTVRRLEWASYLEHIDDRKFDLMSLAWSTGVESDPFELWHSSQWQSRGQNLTGFSDPEADRLIGAIRRETDPAQRYKLQHRLHAILYRECPYIFLFCAPEKGAYAKRYRNVRFYGKRPGYFLEEWFIPQGLQTDQERKRAKLLIEARNSGRSAAEPGLESPRMPGGPRDPEEPATPETPAASAPQPSSSEGGS